jgi:hypothetical protein
MSRLAATMAALAPGRGAVWIDAFGRVGPRRTANEDVFGEGPAAPVRSGVYRRLRDPMFG